MSYLPPSVLSVSPFPERSPESPFQNLLPEPAPSRDARRCWEHPPGTHGQTGARTGPQPHLPGSSAAGASARSGLGCCSGCSPWPSSELMCWGFACLRLDMVRASGRREEPLVTCHQFLELGNFTPLRPERACPSNYYYQ